MGELTANALVSVIIPTYNRAHIIGRTLESAIKQSYRNLEIIVIDDGSMDNTEEVIKAIGDARIRYIRHRENYGGGVARNTGIEAAKGEYIAFLDSDDIWLPNKVEVQLDSIQRHPRPGTVVSYTQLVWCENIQIYDLNEKVPQRGKGPIESLADYLFCNKGVMQTSTLMLSRSLALANRFRPLRMLQDWDFCLRLERKGASFDFLEGLLTICEMDPRRDRVSNLESKFQISLNWILEYQSSISPEATQHFISDYVLPHLNNRKKRIHAQCLVIQAFAKSLITRKQFQEITVNLWGRSRYLSKMKKISEFITRRSSRTTGGSWQDNSWGGESAPPVGRVQFGSLRRVTPISRNFGFDRGLPIDRYYIENFLACQSGDIRGHVLEIGDNSYTRKFGLDRVTQSDVLHSVEGNPNATIVGDLANAPHILSDVFDCVILTQTLQYVYDIRSGVRTIYRILKPGGIVLVTLPCITRLSDPNWNDCWYWGFTNVSGKRLFEENFPSANVEIETYGNALAATAFLQGLATEELERAELDYRDPSYQVLITVRAAKPEEK